MLSVDGWAIADDQGPLEHVAQLTDIAGPIVTTKCVHRLRRQLCPVAAELAEKARREEQNVVAPLPQWGKANVEDVQTIVEVLAERPIRHGIVQMSIGGGDDADVDADRPRATQSQELTLLEHTQELRLRRRRHLGDLVKKQHTAGGQFNLTRLRLLRAGERSTLESEELGLKELLWQRRAIDRGEWAARSWGTLVDESCDDFLAGARLALKARRRFGGCHLRRARDYFPPRWRCADWGVNMSAVDDRRGRTATYCLSGHHRRRPSRVVLTVEEIRCCMCGVHWS